MNTAAPAPPAATPRTRWHRLRVTEVRHLTADTVAVTLHVPADLRQDFTHRPGQHVIVRHRQGGGELRRCYSLCPPPYAPTTLRLVIGRGSPDGFGTYAATRLTPGDHLELSAPTGAFALPDLPGAHHVLLAGAPASPRWPRWPPTRCAGTRPAASPSSTRRAPPPTPCWPTNWPS
ncbi:FAD-binding oxidoreductase [Streptomyces actuosus]|uniref:FAD-binding oxidoreductase n=1 Tax=Streptomyces actuosus TaxID=1885 RepID=UPI001EF92B33|nr:FAD-binding oxidoreductase [Streptomyces actuosus]